MTRRTILVRPRGALLIGGGGATGAHLDVAQMRDPDGAPRIPATALRGAIREQADRLARDSGADVSALFGEPGREGRVRIGDAVIPPRLAGVRRAFTRGEGYEIRHGITITRETHEVSHDGPTRREVIAPFHPELEFEASIETDALDDVAERLLRGAIHAVHSIGYGRTTGLGAVAMSLGAEAEVEDPDPGVAIPDDSDSVLVTLRAREPLLVDGGSISDRGVIPSPTLRGAIVGAVARARGFDADRDLCEDDEFRALIVNPATCVRIGDALPLGDADRNHIPRIAAFTTRRCGQCGTGTATFDTLVRDYVVGRIADAGGRLSTITHCPQCGAAPPADGGRLDEGAARKRLVVTTAMDRARGTPARSGPRAAEALEAGNAFVARIDRMSPAARELLRDAARVGLRIGRGRNRGFGRVRIERVAPVTDEPLQERLAAFDRVVRDATDAAAGACSTPAAVPPLGRVFVAVTARSDVVPNATGATNAERDFLATLGLDGATIGAADVRTTQRGGHDTLRRQPKPLTPAIRAGSVLLLEIDAKLDEIADRLAALEHGGVGARTAEGFGSIRFSDPAHRPGWRTL